MKTIYLKQEMEENTETGPENPGTIDLCPHMGCQFTCCSFQQGNYIVLHPDELEQALRNGVSTSHLELIASYHGGYKAICTAKDTATCDNGFKPLDCRSYPYFPTVTEGKIVANLKGQKCPLPISEISRHALYVQQEWTKVVSQQPAVLQWLDKVELVGYSIVTTDLQE